MFQFSGDLSQVKFYQNNHGHIFAQLTDGSMIDGVRKFLLLFLRSLINKENYFSKFLFVSSLFQSQEQQATNDNIIIIIITVIIIHQKRARVQQQPSLIMKLVSSKKNTSNSTSRRKKNSCSYAFSV